jgi:hypothetical protein
MPTLASVRLFKIAQYRNIFIVVSDLSSLVRKILKRFLLGSHQVYKIEQPSKSATGILDLFLNQNAVMG